MSRVIESSPIQHSSILFSLLGSTSLLPVHFLLQPRSVHHVAKIVRRMRLRLGIRRGSQSVIHGALLFFVPLCRVNSTTHTWIRFQVVVLSAYKQMRAQSSDVLSDVDEDNFDRAFTLLRPG